MTGIVGFGIVGFGIVLVLFSVIGELMFQISFLNFLYSLNLTYNSFLRYKHARSRRELRRYEEMHPVIPEYWSKENHEKFPREFRNGTKAFVLCLKRMELTRGVRVPPVIIRLIVEMSAPTKDFWSQGTKL